MKQWNLEKQIVDKKAEEVQKSKSGVWKLISIISAFSVYLTSFTP